MFAFELRYMKEWQLRKRLTDLRKAQQWKRGGLNRLMQEHIADDIYRIKDELKRRKEAKQHG